MLDLSMTIASIIILCEAKENIHAYPDIIRLRKPNKSVSQDVVGTVSLNTCAELNTWEVQKGRPGT
jgi:hypothetical protein